MTLVTVTKLEAAAVPTCARQAALQKQNAEKICATVISLTVAGVLRLKRLLTYISPNDIGLQGSASQSPVTNGCAASVSRCPLV